MVSNFPCTTQLINSTHPWSIINHPGILLPIDSHCSPWSPTWYHPSGPWYYYVFPFLLLSNFFLWYWFSLQSPINSSHPPLIYNQSHCSYYVNIFAYLHLIPRQLAPTRYLVFCCRPGFFFIIILPVISIFSRTQSPWSSSVKLLPLVSNFPCTTQSLAIPNHPGLMLSNFLCPPLINS